MRQTKYIIGVLFLLVTVLTCTKIDVPEVMEEEPVFELGLMVGGQAEALAAGVDSFFMFTSATVDASGVYSFVGTLEREGCAPNCAPSLSISIRDQAVNLPSAVDATAALAPGAYEIAFSGIDTVFRYFIDFQSIFQALDTLDVQYLWSLPDGQIFSTDANPTIEVADDSPFTFELVAAGGGGVQISRVVRTFDFQTGMFDCSADFSANLIQGGSMLEVGASQAFGTPPLMYEWMPAPSNSGASVLYSLMDSSTFSLPAEICLNLTDGSGCQATTCNTVYQPTPTGQVVNQTGLQIITSPRVEVEVVEDNFQFSQVRMSYVDANGTLYDSSFNVQAADARFEITASEPFADDVNGMPTYQLTLDFSLTLWDSNGNPLPIAGEGAFAVGLPN
ncbi:MAG: hypothetical protein AAF798_10530 [Bacteroidota bacterium]